MGTYAKLGQRLGSTGSRLLVAVLFTTLSAPRGEAQVIRGTANATGSPEPLSGVLISIEAVNPDGTPNTALTVARVLTAPNGEYAIRAPGAGRYRLTAKRIGVHRFMSDVFTLAEGETKRIDVALDPIAQALPEVRVPGICVTRSAELSRIASLWDEVRTALYAAQISARDRLFEAGIVRYASVRDVRTLRVSSEWQAASHGQVEVTFSSYDAESLSTYGYWRTIGRDSIEYAGPDADVLTSPAFLRDHCFSVVPGRGNRRGMVGLAFRPGRDRNLADITGTVWVDERSFELKFVEFRYTRLPVIRGIDRIGGEVHFARLSTGAWIVDRWFIRMPHQQRGGLLQAPVIRTVREDGGHASVPALETVARRASITGTLMDSTNRRPMPGAVVRLAGMSYATRTDGAGRFRLDSLPSGDVHVVAQDAAYDAFNLLAADVPVALRDDVTTTVRLRARSTSDLAERLCDDVRVLRRRAVLMVSLRDSATGVPFPRVRFRVSWYTARVEEPGGSMRVTDAFGAATFCDLPPNIPLEVAMIADNGEAQYVGAVRLKRGEVSAKAVMGKRPRHP
jgi:hypothetical protein